jgi:hypothetical protein
MIHNDQVAWSVSLEKGERGLATVGFRHPIACLPQAFDGHPAHGRIVIDDQDAGAGA